MNHKDIKDRLFLWSREKIEDIKSKTHKSPFKKIEFQTGGVVMSLEYENEKELERLLKTFAKVVKEDFQFLNK